MLPWKNSSQPACCIWLCLKETYNSFLQRPLAQRVIQQNQLKFIVYEPYAEEIVKWTN
ncbi:MAG TPA: hypothetical protein ENG03_00995 [Thioploca sp.]|nr:MAG: hypothetical protein DRR08_15940 [Gammaproteobacteria bacterium]HDN25677.1 hypothetical protein [Thioploca sp.]